MPNPYRDEHCHEVETSFSCRRRANGAALGEHPLSPYAGQQTRAIKALSPEDLAGLLNGEGRGMAKAAELNGYPGPVHVLELAGSPRRNSSKFRRFSIA